MDVSCVELQCTHLRNVLLSAWILANLILAVLIPVFDQSSLFLAVMAWITVVYYVWQ